MNPTKDNETMQWLRIDHISHILAQTSKGTLTCKLLKGESTYKFFLDAVPCDDEQNRELRKLYGTSN